MKKLLLLTIILWLVTITACSVPDTRTSQEKVQDKLLKELDDCDYKFGTDSEQRRQMTQEYCHKLIDTIDELIRDGYFSETGTVKEIIREKEIEVNSTQPEADDVDTAINEIIGDI